MDGQQEKRDKSAMMYDTGSGCMMVMLFGGLVSGAVGHYPWNYLVPSIYSSGGWPLVGMFFGAAFLGVTADYFWNYLILNLGLRWQQLRITARTGFTYITMMTAAAFLIDWLYYQLAWGGLPIGSLRIPAIFADAGANPGLQLSTIVIPMALIAVVNYFASRFHLHLDNRPALLVSLVMAAFTAPSVLVAFVLLRG
jgi:hypothetical protein